MARQRIEITSQAFAQLAKSDELRKLVKDAADGIARRVRLQNIKVGDRDGGKHEIDLPVRVDVTTTDRARAAVVLAHPSGIAVQAKHGALSKAAAAEGLEVRGD